MIPNDPEVAGTKQAQMVDMCTHKCGVMLFIQQSKTNFKRGSLLYFTLLYVKVKYIKQSLTCKPVFIFTSSDL